jgi:hypothetical protein
MTIPLAPAVCQVVIDILLRTRTGRKTRNNVKEVPARRARWVRSTKEHLNVTFKPSDFFVQIDALAEQASPNHNSVLHRSCHSGAESIEQRVLVISGRGRRSERCVHLAARRGMQ